MSGNKSWYQRLSPFNRESTEVKALQTRLDAVAGEFNDALQYEAKFYDAEPSSYSGSGNFDFAGIDQVVNSAALQRIYSSETWVYVAVNAIAQTIAGLPIKLEKRTIVKKEVVNELTGKPESIDTEVWVNASGEKLFKRFAYPNEFTTKAEFYNLLLIDLLTAGEYYVFLDSETDLSSISDGSDEDANSAFGRLRQLMASDTPITAMYRIPPSLMKPVPSESGIGIEGYHMQSDRGSFVFAPAEMIHVKLPNPCNPHGGLSPLIAAFKPVLLDRFSTEHMVRFYKSGARLGGVIQTEKTLNKEQLGRFQRSFENNYTGRQNFHRTLILPPGMEYKPIEQNPAESALLEFVKHNREAILAAYRVPPIKAGIMDGANYANARAQMKTFFNDTIKPILTFVEDGFNLKQSLMPSGNVYRFKFDLSQEESLKDDYAEKAKAARDMLEAGLTVDEVRKLVFEAQPIDGGNQSPVVSRIRRETMVALAQTAKPEAEEKPTESQTEEAPVSNEKPQGDAPAGTAQQAQEDIAANQVTDPTLSLNGAQVTAMLDIVNRVAQGMMPRASGVEMIIAAFSVPRENAERIMGEVGSSFTIEAGKPTTPAEPSVEPIAPTLPEDGKAADQADTAAIGEDIKPTKVTFTERVSELTAQFVQQGMPLNVAIAKAIEQAKTEGFTDEDPTDPDDDGTPPNAPNSDGSGAPDQSTPPADESAKSKPTLDDYIRDELAKLGDEQVSVDLVGKLIEQYQSSQGVMVDAKTEQGAIQERQVYAFGMSKDKTAETWKSFVVKSHPFIEKRLGEVQKFFNDFKSVMLNRLGANIKAYGMTKARDEDDINEILNLEGYEALIADYIKTVDKALLEAAKLGFGDTLVEFEMSPPDAKAAEALRTYLAGKIKGITEVTLEQMRAVLADSFSESEAGKPIAEVAKAITEKFAEISTGRAQTIARTETLTAISIGKEIKRQEYQAEFPDKKLMKMWVSAQDEVVRESHQDLDGVSVPVDADFKENLAFPRDPRGEAGEVINCRCTDITFMAEDQERIEDELPKKPDGETE